MTRFDFGPIGLVAFSASGALDQRSFREHMLTRFEDEICVTTTMTKLDRRHRMPHDVRSSLAT